MNENEFWVAQLRTLIAGALLFIMLAVGSCQLTNIRVIEAIEAGAHPVIAECALADTSCDTLLVIELEKLRNAY